MSLCDHQYMSVECSGKYGILCVGDVVYAFLVSVPNIA